jgi:RNA 3'-terminal phosphate cyclase (ATP)
MSQTVSRRAILAQASLASLALGARAVLAEPIAAEEIKDARGPGNAVMIELEAEHITEVFTAFGRLGVRAEDVAREALCQAEEYVVAGVPVGKHLADQLMLPLGIGAYLGSGGGVFRTMGLSLHSTTHMEILRRFLEIGIQLDRKDDNRCLVRLDDGP